MNHSLEMKKLPLEDLQEKFAAIVQEARNNPCLLEQFMIWLDMKVAEYKAKGVILLGKIMKIKNQRSWHYWTTDTRVTVHKENPVFHHDDVCSSNLM